MTREKANGIWPGSVIAATLGAILLAISMAVPALADELPPLCNGLSATWVGGAGNDYFQGTAGVDVVVDPGGANYIQTGGGADHVCTGDGRDEIDSGDGDDYVDAGAGANKVKTGNGDDTVVSGDGDDDIDGGNGDDEIYAGGGRNKITTGNGSDRVTAGDGNDEIDTGNSNDTIDAGNGHNTVKTGGGNDHISTGSGDDRIEAGAGFDTCLPGAGSNRLKSCEEVQTAFDGRAALTFDTAGAVSALIGRAGGELAAGPVRLIVPPGAVLEEVDITVTPMTALGNTPVDAGFVAGVRLEPQGLHFLRTVVLELAMPSDPGGVVVGFGSSSDGTGFHLVPSLQEGGTLSIPLWHFSAAGAVAADPTQIEQVLSYQPSPAHEAAQQAVAAEIATAAANGVAPDEAVLIAALRAWYTGSVRPGLQVAFGQSQEFFELAVGEWLAGWRPEVALVGLQDALAAEDQQAAGLALDAAANLAGRVLSRCTPTGDVGDMLSDAGRLANVLQLDETDFRLETRQAGGRQLPSSGNLLRACVSVDVESLIHSAVFALDIDNPVEARVATVFWNGGRTYDFLTVMELVNNAAASEVVEDSGLVSTGTWETTVSPTELGFYNRSVRGRLAAGADSDVLQALDDSASLLVPVRERLELTARGPADADFVSQPAAIAAGGSVSFRVRLAGPGVEGQTLSYGLSGQGSLSQASGTTSSTGLAAFTYTAPATGNATPTVSVSFQDGADTRVASIQLTVTEQASVQVAVSPNSVSSIGVGDTIQFSAVVTGSIDTSVTWSATGGGSVSANGLFTATSPGLASVTATSNADGQATDTVGFQVTQNVVVTVSPSAAAVFVGGTRQLAATVNGSANQAVTWSTSCGTIIATGLFTAPATPATCTVTATSVAQPSASGTASIAVMTPPAIAITDVSGGLRPSGAGNANPAPFSGSPPLAIQLTNCLDDELPFTFPSISVPPCAVTSSVGSAVGSASLAYAPTYVGESLTSISADATSSAAAVWTGNLDSYWGFFAGAGGAHSEIGIVSSEAVVFTLTATLDGASSGPIDCASGQSSITVFVNGQIFDFNLDVSPGSFTFTRVSQSFGMNFGVDSNAQAEGIPDDQFHICSTSANASASLEFTLTMEPYVP